MERRLLRTSGTNLDEVDQGLADQWETSSSGELSLQNHLLSVELMGEEAGCQQTFSDWTSATPL